MNLETLPEPAAALPQGRFGGRVEFEALVRQGFACAAAQGWRELVVCDPNFVDWPLGERALVQSLHDWSKSGRKFTMLASSYDEIVRQHPRFVVWRQTWSHIVECRRSAGVAGDSLTSAFLSPAWAFERIDIARCNGVASNDAVARVALQERLKERLLNSSSSFPATTLGL